MQPPDAAGMLHPHTVKSRKGRDGGKDEEEENIKDAKDKITKQLGGYIKSL